MCLFQDFSCAWEMNLVQGTTGLKDGRDPPLLNAGVFAFQFPPDDFLPLLLEEFTPVKRLEGKCGKMKPSHLALGIGRCAWYSLRRRDE